MLPLGRHGATILLINISSNTPLTEGSMKKVTKQNHSKTEEQNRLWTLPWFKLRLKNKLSKTKDTLCRRIASLQAQGFCGLLWPKTRE